MLEYRADRVLMMEPNSATGRVTDRRSKSVDDKAGTRGSERAVGRLHTTKNRRKIVHPVFPIAKTRTPNLFGDNSDGRDFESRASND